jgi:hypothetical protein
MATASQHLGLWMTKPPSHRYELIDATVWQLQDQAYVEVGHVEGQEQLDLRVRYPVTIRPAALVD